MFRNPIYKYLSKNDLQEITSEVKQFETHTLCQLKICLRYKRGIHQKSKTPKELALYEFHKLKVQKTKLRNGILLFILFKERKLEILFDSGLKEILSEQDWNICKDLILNDFKINKYKEGLIELIRSLTEKINGKFLTGTENTNEISDDIVIK